MFPSALWEKGTTTWHSDTSIAPQDIKGSHHHARYCGTPLPVSFDETYPHSVSIIELEKGAEPQISTREIENPIPLVTLPHDPTPFEDALKLLEEYPEEKPAYLRLNVLTKGYLPPTATKSLERRQRQGMQILLHQDYLRAAGRH